VTIAVFTLVALLTNLANFMRIADHYTNEQTLCCIKLECSALLFSKLIVPFRHSSVTIAVLTLSAVLANLAHFMRINIP
jgi:hypothetical protein